VKGQRTAGNQSWRAVGLLGVVRTRPQERIALGFVDHHDQADDRDMIAHLWLELQQVPPRLRMRITVDRAFHQVRQHYRQIQLGPAHGNRGWRTHETAPSVRAKVTRGKVATRLTPSSSTQPTC
jgi:hypothetical protein